MKLTSEQRAILIESATAIVIDGERYTIVEIESDMYAVHVVADDGYETYFWYDDVVLEELVYE